jgi:hypothetical protein
LGTENGGGAYSSYITNHPGDFPLDDDGDGFIQMGEAFDYANTLNTWTVDDCFIPPVPFSTAQNPVETDQIPFEEDLITLAGLSGYILSNQTIPARSYIIADELYIGQGISLIFSDNSEVFINRNVIQGSSPLNARIVSLETSSIIFGESNTVTNGNELANLAAIVIHGDIFEIGNNSTFNYINIGIPDGIEYFSPVNVDFSNCKIIPNYCENFIFNDCVLKNVFIHSHHLNHVDFNSNICLQTHLLFDSFPTENSIELTNNSFNGICQLGYVGECQVYINGYDRFLIEGNELYNGIRGVNIYNSGWNGSHLFTGNKIYNNSKSGNLNYNSRITFKENYIYDNNEQGLYIFHNSEILISGNKDAEYVNETQRFMNNGGYEIYTDYSSFPYYFKFNAIVDDDNFPGNDQLVYCDVIAFGNELNVQFNFWGNNFNVANDLYPAEEYTYLPIFDLEFEEDEPAADEELFTSAMDKFDAEDYTVAKTEFMEVVQLYPDSKFADASLKELYALEKNEANDYYTLKQYYNSNPNIANDTSLTKLAIFLANQCNIKLEN